MMRRPFFAQLGAATLLAGVSVSGCGLFEPHYEKYGETASNNPDDPCVIEALAEFAVQIAPAVDGTCAVAGCHVAFSIAGAPLVRGDDAHNRAQLKAFAGSDANVLFDKISINGTSHTGGNQSAVLPKANIEAWLAKEICE